MRPSSNGRFRTAPRSPPSSTRRSLHCPKTYKRTRRRTARVTLRSMRPSAFPARKLPPATRAHWCNSARIDPATVAKEKRRIIARERVLEWYDPIRRRSRCCWRARYSQSAGSPPARPPIARRLANTACQPPRGPPGRRARLRQDPDREGDRAPRGACRCCGSTWALSNQSLWVRAKATCARRFKVIEAIGRCVVWLDEIEKALQGATSGSRRRWRIADALGTILSWMQERAGEVVRHRDRERRNWVAARASPQGPLRRNFWLICRLRPSVRPSSRPRCSRMVAPPSRST